MIEVYKIVHGHSPIALEDFFEFDKSGRTRGNDPLFVQTCQTQRNPQVPKFQVTKTAISIGPATAFLLGDSERVTTKCGIN